MAAIKMVEMSVKEFTKIPDNPAQRDTFVHAKRARKGHLKTYHISHGRVAIAVNGKERWKLDGHTRCYLWDEGTLKAPAGLSVDVYKVEGRQEAADLYAVFDSHDAVESKQDQLTGAFRYYKITTPSPTFIRNSGIINAIQHLERAQNKVIPRETIRDKVGRYKKPLKALAAQGWTHTHNKEAKVRKPGFNSMCVAAFIVTYTVDGEACLGFWDAFVNGVNEQLRSGKSASFVAGQWMAYARENQLTIGRHNAEIGVVTMLNAYSFYKKRQALSRISELYKADRNKSPSMQIRELLKKTKYGQ